MSQTTVEIKLEDVLVNIQKDLKEIRDDLTDLKVEMATVKTTVQSVDKRLENVETEQKTLIKDIADLKGAKSLIIPIIVAVTTSLVTILIRAIPPFSH